MDHVLWQDSVATALSVDHALRIGAIDGEIVIVWDGVELCRIFDVRRGFRRHRRFRNRSLKEPAASGRPTR